MNISEVLDMTLQEIIDSEASNSFSYEVEPVGEYRYEFDYLMSGHRRGDPEGYANGRMDIPEYARINLFYQNEIFAYGDLDFIPDDYDLNYLHGNPEGAAESYGEEWAERMYGSGDYPDGAIISSICDIFYLSDYYPQDMVDNTTLRQLVNSSELFQLIV